MKRILAGCIGMLLAVTVFGQVSVKDSAVFAPMVRLSYGLQVPYGDLQDRFGLSSTLGGSFIIKNKHNILYGVDGNFLFGNDVKETEILDGLKDRQGNITNEVGEITEFILLERGLLITGKVGILIPVIGPNPNSGLLLLGGVGLLQHKIRIEVQNNTAPQIRDDYKKGYDRLTNGLALTQFIGYQHLGNGRLVNFFGGVELIQGFTKNRRSYNFDTQEKDDKARTDLTVGFRVGWMLPLYKRVPREFYFE